MIENTIVWGKSNFTIEEYENSIVEVKRVLDAHKFNIKEVRIIVEKESV